MNSKSFKAMIALAVVLAVIAGGVIVGGKMFGAGSPSEEKRTETALTRAPAAPAETAKDMEEKHAPPAELAPAKADKPETAKAQEPVKNVSVGAAPGLGEIREWIAAGKTFEAREALAKLFIDEKTTPALRAEMEGDLVKLAETMFIKKPSDRDFEFYTVQGGDSLIRIAQYFRTEKKMAVEFGQIKMFSGLTRDLINVGMKLKIPKGRMTIVVRKSAFKLHVMYEGIIVKTYKVGLGKNDGTPCGRFAVSTKTASPTWYPPESTGLKGPIPPNDPRNALGSHWIGLSHDTHQGLGIHGTLEPNSIGTQSSLGCVRMLNEEVKHLFELVTPGMDVLILD